MTAFLNSSPLSDNSVEGTPCSQKIFASASATSGADFVVRAAVAVYLVKKSTHTSMNFPRAFVDGIGPMRSVEMASQGLSGMG